jgi:hypothetical protein
MAWDITWQWHTNLSVAIKSMVRDKVNQEMRVGIITGTLKINDTDTTGRDWLWCDMNNNNNNLLY